MTDPETGAPTLMEELAAVTADVWSSFTGSTPAPLPASVDVPDTVVTSIVGIGGAFEGGVVLTMPQAMAEEVTAVLFAMPDVDTELVHDAIGELTNMLAGNLKELLPGPSHLTLPVVTSGREYVMTSPQAEPLVRASFDLDGSAFTIAVIRSQSGSAR